MDTGNSYETGDNLGIFWMRCLRKTTRRPT